MSTNALIKELKENNQDFEFYPTTKEMVEAIYNDVDNNKSWLDIGCGACHFKRWFKELHDEQAKLYAVQEDVYRQHDFDSAYQPHAHVVDISTYYVIEKADIFLKYFDSETICLGRDFFATELIDKEVENLFCNPPYSEYVEWTERIILEGNFKTAYLIIPKRWKENKNIQDALKITKYTATTIGEFDFLHAERQARAKVEIVKIKRDAYRNDAFDRFFDKFFKFKPEKSWREEEEEQEKLRAELVSISPKDKLKTLCDLYEKERKTLANHFEVISNLDSDILESIGVDRNKVKEALKQKRDSLKIKYWNLLFDQLDEITDRLTTTTCNNLFSNFKNIHTVNFEPETIYPILLWLIKNANLYFDEQLLDFFDNMTEPDNIRNYKSNIKVFKRCKWRPEQFDDKKEVTHYTLHYRIVCSNRLFCDPYGQSQYRYYGEQVRVMRNIATIAKNLGFDVDNDSIYTYENSNLPTGKKGYVYLKNGDVLFEFKHYQNGNVHLKFNTEFMQAINIQVGKLRNWIQTVADIEEEFPEEYKKDAEKYFNCRFTFLPSSLKMLPKFD